MTLTAATSIKIGLYEKCKAIETALISSRVYPGKAPDNATMPYAVFNRIDGTPERLITGSDSSVTEMFQLTFWGATPESVEEVAASFKTALGSFSGSLGGFTVLSVTLESFGDMPEEFEADGSKVAAYGVRHDYKIIY